MKNILGHSKDLTLYGSCGNVMYKYQDGERMIVETFYDVSGEIVKLKTFVKDEGKY